MSDLNVDINLDELEGQLPGQDTATPPDAENLYSLNVPVFTVGLKLPEEMLTKIGVYLEKEILNVRDGDGRSRLATRWKKWRRQLEVQPEKEIKTFPWKGASNVVPPLMLSKVNVIYSKLKRSLNALVPFFIVNSKKKALAEHAIDLQTFINDLITDPKKVNLPKANRAILYGSVSLGASFVYTDWDKTILSLSKVNETLSPGSAQTPDDVEQFVTYNGPKLKVISIEDFFTQPYWSDIQTAPWIAVRSYFYYHELKALEAIGALSDVKRVLDIRSDQVSEELEDTLKYKGIEVDQPEEDISKEYEIYECFLKYDINNDGIAEDLKVIFEPTNRVILRVELNNLGMRPITRIPHLELPNQLYPMGVCQMISGTQDEAESLHNLRIDANVLHALQMRVARRGSGVRMDEEYHPGKTILVDDLDSFKAFQYPDISQSLLQGEQIAKTYAAEASGANPQMGGMDASQGNRIGATGTQFLAQEGDSVLDTVRESLSEAFTEVGLLLTLQLIQNKKELDLNSYDEGVQTRLTEVFNLRPVDFLREFSFTVQTAKLDETDAGKRENIGQVSQLYAGYVQRTNGYYNALLSLTGQIAQNDPAGQQALMAQMNSYRDLLMSSIVGETKLLEQMLDFYGIKDVANYTPYTRDMEQMNKISDQNKNDALGVDEEGRSNETGNEQAEFGPGIRGTETGPTADFGPGGVVSAGGTLPTPGSPGTGQ